MYWRQKLQELEKRTAGFWPGAPTSAAVPAPLSRLRLRVWEEVPGKDTDVCPTVRSRARPSRHTRSIRSREPPARRVQGPFGRAVTHRIYRARWHGAGRMTEASRLAVKRGTMFSTSKSSGQTARGNTPAGLPDTRLQGRGCSFGGPPCGSSARCPPAEGRKAPASQTWKESTFPQLFQSPILFTLC